MRRSLPCSALLGRPPHHFFPRFENEIKGLRFTKLDDRLALLGLITKFTRAYADEDWPTAQVMVDFFGLRPQVPKYGCVVQYELSIRRLNAT